MLQPGALDPYTRSLLTLLGETMLALARGEAPATLSLPSLPSPGASSELERMQHQLRAVEDGPRKHPSRSRYRLTPLKSQARQDAALEALTPAGRRIVQTLQEGDRSVKELVEITGYRRKTVENLLSTIRKAGLLESFDV
jgi:DNA-binding CsgD family transcriptional regulator